MILKPRSFLDLYNLDTDPTSLLKFDPKINQVCRVPKFPQTQASSFLPIHHAVASAGNKTFRCKRHWQTSLVNTIGFRIHYYSQKIFISHCDLLLQILDFDLTIHEFLEFTFQSTAALKLLTPSYTFILLFKINKIYIFEYWHQLKHHYTAAFIHAVASLCSQRDLQMQKDNVRHHRRTQWALASSSSDICIPNDDIITSVRRLMYRLKQYRFNYPRVQNRAISGRDCDFPGTIAFKRT